MSIFSQDTREGEKRKVLTFEDFQKIKGTDNKCSALMSSQISESDRLKFYEKVYKNYRYGKDVKNCLEVSCDF